MRWRWAAVEPWAGGGSGERWRSSRSSPDEDRGAKRTAGSAPPPRWGARMTPGARGDRLGRREAPPEGRLLSTPSPPTAEQAAVVRSHPGGRLLSTRSRPPGAASAAGLVGSPRHGGPRVEARRRGQAISPTRPARQAGGSGGKGGHEGHEEEPPAAAATGHGQTVAGRFTTPGPHDASGHPWAPPPGPADPVTPTARPHRPDHAHRNGAAPTRNRGAPGPSGPHALTRVAKSWQHGVTMHGAPVSVLLLT